MTTMVAVPRLWNTKSRNNKFVYHFQRFGSYRKN